MMPTRNNYTGFPKMGEPTDRLTAFRAALRPMIAKMADHDPAQYRSPRASDAEGAIKKHTQSMKG